MSWLERCDISVVHGDLFDQKVDALVVPVECSLTFAHVLGRQLLDRHGHEFRAAASEAGKRLFGDRVPLGGGFSIPVDGSETSRWVVLVAWWDSENSYTQNLIERCISTAFRRAFETQSKSVALPLFGVNSSELKLHDLYAAIPKALREFDSLRQSDTFSVEDLRFVCRQPLVVDELRQVLQLHEIGSDGLTAEV